MFSLRLQLWKTRKSRSSLRYQNVPTTSPSVPVVLFARLSCQFLLRNYAYPVSQHIIQPDKLFLIRARKPVYDSQFLLLFYQRSYQAPSCRCIFVSCHFNCPDSAQIHTLRTQIEGHGISFHLWRNSILATPIINSKKKGRILSRENILWQDPNLFLFAEKRPSAHTRKTLQWSQRNVQPSFISFKYLPCRQHSPACRHSASSTSAINHFFLLLSSTFNDKVTCSLEKNTLATEQQSHLFYLL